MTTISVGQRVGTFVLRELLGGTALAVVYRALDESTGEEVGLKLLRGYFTQEPALAKTFLDEMERVRSLQHPGILSPIRSDTDGSNVWVVLPFVPWRTLQQRIETQGGALPPHEAITILQSAADALDHAHAGNMVHLDLKPGNIFVGEAGETRVEGFGMVTLAAGVHASMRVTLNTPHPTYMAPEQAGADDSRDPAHDVYALATMAYELLTGTVPFFGSGGAAIVRKRAGNAPAPSQINPALPPEVDTVLAASLHRHTSERYTAAGALVAALRAALGALAEAPASPPPVAAMTTELATAHEVEEAAEIICRSCGHGNPASRLNCDECWAVLSEEFQPTREQADLKRRLRARDIFRGRMTRMVGIPVAALAIALYLYGQMAGFTHSVPAPSTTISSVSAPGEWAMHGRDLAHTSSEAHGVALAGELAWTFDSTGPVLASPAVVDGRVYLPTGDRRIVALDATDGRLLWEFPTTGPMDSSPTVAEGTVFVGLRDGRLLALNADNGALRWEYETGNPIMGPPVIHEGVVYLGSGDGFLYALDARLGSFLWSYDTESWISTGPAVQDNMVVVSNHQGWVHVVDWTTGESRMTYDTMNGSVSAPVFVGDDILVGLGNGRMLAIDSTKLEYPMERGMRFWRAHFFLWGLQDRPPVQKGFSWRKQVGSREARLTTPTVLEGRAYVGDNNGIVQKLDLATREVLWTRFVGTAVTAPPVAVGPVVYFGTSDGLAHAMERSSGETLWTFATGGEIEAQPVVANDTLYVSSHDGTLYAIR